MKFFFIFLLFLFSLTLSSDTEYLGKPEYEVKLVDILGHPGFHKKLEASGIYYHNKKYYIIFDNIDSIAIIGEGFKKETLTWIETKPSSGFEGIGFSEKKQSFFLLEEASLESIPFGYIHEYKLKENLFINPIQIPFPLESRKGFEGIASYTFENKEYFALLLEKDEVRHPKSGLQGNLLIMQNHPKEGLKEIAFHSLASIGFKDYSDIAIFKGRVAIVSQKSSAIWVGSWDVKNHKPLHGRKYLFPLVNADGKFYNGFQKGYCNVEGITWINEDTLAFVSDRQKKRKRKDSCSFKEEMLHIFRIPKI